MGNSILHVDMDAFFANVEKVDNPGPKKHPVIVGNHPNESSRGVVATCCYIARKYGVRSAMPTTQAIKLCPHAKFIRPNSKRYGEVSKEVMEVFYKFTPAVEPISIDEAFLDISGCEKLFGSPMDIAQKIQREIFNKTSLTCSIGIAPNKFLAKLASDLKKPNGITVICSDKIEEILDPLPVSKIWGVGNKQQEKLHSLGVRTIGQLKKIEQVQLKSMFGALGISLYNLARGVDNRKVETGQEIKSVSNEVTFDEDILDDQIIKSYILKLSDKVSRRLRKQRLIGKTVHIKVKYHDFKTGTAQVSLSDPSSLPSEIFSKVWDLYLKREHKSKKIRLIGVGISNLFPDDYKQQLSLFANVDKTEKETKLLSSLDNILEKYGDKAVYRGSEKNINKVRRDDNGSLV